MFEDRFLDTTLILYFIKLILKTNINNISNY